MEKSGSPRPDSPVRVRHAQPASPVSVGHVLVPRILATFPRVITTMRGRLGAIFWIFDRNWSISCASLWSPISNIRVLVQETRFELA
jgi:hypothetical protein